MELNTHKLLAARLWAVRRYPYLTAALFASPVISSPGVKGAAVDESWRLYVDPEFVDRTSVEILGGLLVHHAGHLVRDHSGRASSAGVHGGSKKDWALAADAEINDDLIGTGLRLPNDRIVPHDLGWKAGRLAEEYYRAPHKHTESEPDCGSGSDSQHREWELDPWSGTVRDGEVWGRGALDMKGEVAAIAVAIAALVREGYERALELDPRNVQVRIKPEAIPEYWLARQREIQEQAESVVDHPVKVTLLAERWDPRDAGLMW